MVDTRISEENLPVDGRRSNDTELWTDLRIHRRSPRGKIISLCFSMDSRRSNQSSRVCFCVSAANMYNLAEPCEEVVALEAALQLCEAKWRSGCCMQW